MTAKGRCVPAKSLKCVLLFVTPWTVAHQAPLSVGFSRQEYWSGLPCPPPGHLPDPGMEPVSLMSPALAREFFTTSTAWEAQGKVQERSVQTPKPSPRLGQTSHGYQGFLVTLNSLVQPLFSSHQPPECRAFSDVSSSLQVPQGPEQGPAHRTNE